VTPLVVRADASAQIGAGHVMRCLALAEAWARTGGGAVEFAAAELPESLRRRLIDGGFGVVALPGPAGGPEDLAATRALAAERGAACVIDGYAFGREYQRSVQRAGTTLVVDDGHRGEGFAADLVLDQNLGAAEAHYAPLAPGAELLLGTRFALLRSEFLASPRPERSPGGRRVLVTLGGSDPAGLSEGVARALSENPVGTERIEVCLVLGGSNPCADAIARALAATEVEVVRDAWNMPELMARADLAVAAAGSTCWELCYSALPALLVVVADNQRDIAAQLDAAGAAVNLGWHERVTPAHIATAARALLNQSPARTLLAQNAARLVDGQGADRVASRLRALAEARLVLADDA
jgi:UDP-2,4-diacetamido-2,4,6-trideoxy-beta-L-altropyranose hydrolase